MTNAPAACFFVYHPLKRLQLCGPPYILIVSNRLTRRVGMNYITVRQAADKWGVSERWVHKLCQNNRIKGQIRFSTVWMIPADAEKPPDARLNNAAPVRKSKRRERKQDE